MYNFASLAAEQDALRDYRKLFKDIKVDDLSRHEIVLTLRAADTYNERSDLLQRLIDVGDHDDLMLFCHAELNIHKYIKREVWVTGKVNYMLGLEKRSIKANPKQAGALTLNKMLLDGYKFEENIGEHFIITAPKGGMRATTTKHCTCGAKDCIHQMAIKEIISNRKRCKGLYRING